jgi:hypothetical protein
MDGLKIRQKLLMKNARNPEQCTQFHWAIYSLFRCLGSQLREPVIVTKKSVKPGAYQSVWFGS